MDQEHSFDFIHYLYTIRDLFLQNFQQGSNIQDYIFREISFAERQDFDKIYLQPPSLILDIYEARVSAPSGGVNQEGTSIYSNLGNLSLSMGVCAKIVVNQGKVKEIVEPDRELINVYKSPLDDREPIVIDEPSVLVRKLAFDVAVFVTNAGRFNQPVGLSQVTRIGPSNDSGINQGTLLVWEVMWQHSLGLGEPAHRDFDDCRIEAEDVKEIQVGFDVSGKVIEERDPTLLDDPPSLDMDPTNPERDRRDDTEIIFYRRPSETYERPPQEES